jgi:DNA-binding NarL/FixJ family response regulator
MKVLSDRQVQVLDLLLEGCSEKDIAERIYLSHHTIHLHAKQLYRIFSVHSRAELLALWIGRMQPNLRRQITTSLIGRPLEINRG